MRPIALDVQGFTCFREAQPTLDLSALSLFAITGPTGAGKSSVLDAVTFALYGKVSRMGRGSVKDLISHGRDRMSVTLRFTARDRLFVVTRMVRRTSGPGLCQLDERVGDVTTTLASGVHEVDDAIERLVGLDYDAFTQAVVLPQGEFARFLRGAPAQRRQILQELLRLTIYNRMQRLAGERCRDAKRDVEAAERQLEAYADATPEAIAAAEDELARVVVVQPQVVEARDEARRQRVEMEARVHLARDLAARRADLAVALKEDGAQVARLERIARSRRARQVGVAIEQFADARARLEMRTAEHEGAVARLAGSQAVGTSTHARLDAARQALADLGPVKARIAVLRGLEGRLRHRDALDDECRLLARDVASLTREVAAKEADGRAQAQRLEDAMSDEARLDASLRAMAYDSLELQACEQGRDLARELRSLRAQGPAVEMKWREAQEATRESARIAEAQAAALEDARQAFARAETARVEAVRRLTEAQDAHRAMTLRRHLHAGDACPVCEQTVATVPAVALPPELTSLFDVQNDASEACRTFAERVTAHHDLHVRALAAADGARSQLAAVEHMRAELRDRITSSVATLVADLRHYLPASSASMPEHWLLERLDDLNAIRAQRETRARQHQIAQATRVDAEHRVALATQALEACQRDLATRRQQLVARQTAHDQLHAEILAITDAADPRAELARLERRLVDAEGALDAARVEAQRDDTELAAATEAERLATRLCEEARTALATIAERAGQALSALGFASAEEAAAALLDDEALETLEAHASGYTRHLAAVTAQVADLETRVGPAAVSEAQLAACIAQERDAEQAVTDTLRRAAQLEVQVGGMRARALHASTLHGQLAAARAAHEIHARLSADLKADAFQAWLLREAFERLVAGASSRLLELSGRYTLQWRDDEFVVVDHDNAQEVRAADTLSGGETFLASLALALELSEQVQRAAGAVRLDSLFIDEGFGTLDAAAQDVVASAIESLQVSGRMVGIITHVRELTDRMPACIVIDKRPEGSRWDVRT
ncbi:AAA family ATPase [Luteitalea sp.]